MNESLNGSFFAVPKEIRGKTGGKYAMSRDRGSRAFRWRIRLAFLLLFFSIPGFSRDPVPEAFSNNGPDGSNAIDSLNRRILQAEKSVADLIEVHKDSGHPEVVRARTGLSFAYEESGRFAEAEETIRKNLPFLEKAWLRDPQNHHAPYREALFVLGGVLIFENRLEQAEAVLKRGEDVWMKTSKMVEPPPVPLCRILKGVLYDLTKRGGSALEVYRDAVSGASRDPLPLTAFVLPQIRRVALRMEALGRYPEAVLLQKRALSIVEDSYHCFHPEMILTLKRLAELYAKTGETDLETRMRNRMERILSEENRIGKKFQSR